MKKIILATNLYFNIFNFYFFIYIKEWLLFDIKFILVLHLVITSSRNKIKKIVFFLLLKYFMLKNEIKTKI
jgi:hypothetical protein